MRLLPLLLVACSSPAPDAMMSTHTTPPAVTVTTACTGPDQRQYGTACCDVRGKGEQKSPGMVFLTCTGPRIGKPCTSKNDCDIACSCDPPGAIVGGGTPPQGPPDGTRGATGVCGARLQVGTWMCQIDERGVVTHTIVD